MRGDGSWLDFDFCPYSLTLGGPVSFKEDAEEWARSLPGAYANTEMKATIIIIPVARRHRAHNIGPPSPPRSTAPASGVTRGMSGGDQWAGWWRRFAAVFLDGLLLVPSQFYWRFPRLSS